ncbi:MAG: T9SS type A sorting domain-containing protein [Aureispira sp.]
MNTTTIQEQLKKHYQKLQTRLQKAQSKGRSQSFQELLMSRIQRCAIQLRQLGAGVAVVTALGWAAPALGQNTIPLQYEEKVGVDNPLDTVLTNNFLGSLSFVDIDGDGDKDLVERELSYTPSFTVKCNYHKNIGSSTMPVFELQANSTMLDTLSSFSDGLAFVDIDGDGDQDLFVSDVPYYSGSSTTQLDYYKNTSLDPANPEYTLQTVANNPLQDAVTFYNAVGLSTPPTLFAKFVDIDGDGDQDCFIGAGGYLLFPTANNGDRVVYYKNEGSPTMPNFQRQSASNNPLDIINTTLDNGEICASAFEFFDGDLVRDLDLDVFVRGTNTEYYFNNTGTVNSPNFSLSTTSPIDSIWMNANVNVRTERLRGIEDLTNDGRSEVVYINNAATKLRYFVDTVSYLNQLVLQGAKPLEAYPNPSTGLIQLEQAYTGLLEVYTTTGQLVYKKELEEVEQLNLELLDTGIYVVSLQTPKERFVQQITIIK